MHHRAGQRPIRARPHAPDARPPRRRCRCGTGPPRRTRAPRSFRARVTWVITLTCVATGLPPHMTIRSLSAISRGSGPRIRRRRPSSRIPRRGADRAFLAGVAHHVAQALDPVALHQPHGAGEEVGPDRLRPVPRGDVGEGGRHAVQRLVPADRAELAGALRPGSQQRRGQAVGDDAAARHSGRPSRRSPRPCSCCPAPRARRRCDGCRAHPPPARSRRGSHAGRQSLGRSMSLSLRHSMARRPAAAQLLQARRTT